MARSKSILIVFSIILVCLIPTWLCSNKISSIKEGIYCTDADSLFYHRIIDQAYYKGSEKYLDHDNYGNFPHLFKIGYPRFYFWTLLVVKHLCASISLEKADVLFNFFPVIITTITALVIFISLWAMKYPPTFLAFTAFLLITTFPALNVGNYGKIDYDHILSLYIWGWLLCAMFYQDTEKKKWLYIGGLFAGLVFGSWLGSLLIFSVVSLVCFILWIFKSSICKKYLPYCYTTFGISALINTLVVLFSPTRYGFVLLDFGIIHILAIWLATAGIYTLTKINNTNRNIIITTGSLFVIIMLFIIVASVTNCRKTLSLESSLRASERGVEIQKSSLFSCFFNINNIKDLLEKVFAKDPIFVEINELQPLINFSKLFVNAKSVEKAISNYGILLFLFPLFIVIPAQKIINRESASLLKLWLIIPILASFYQNRYTRILGIGSSVYAAFILYFLWNIIKGAFEEPENNSCSKNRHCEPLKEAWQSRNINRSKMTFYLGFTLLLLFTRASYCWGILNYSNPIRKSELEAFYWIKNNTPTTSGYSDNKEPEYGVLAYWDFGNLINFYAHRPVIANNMQNGVKHMADIFSSKNEEEADKLCDSLKIKYVFITPDRILFPSTIDYWPAYKNQKTGLGYTALPANVERSKDYDRWFYTWLTKDFGLRTRGDFGTTSNFRIVFASYEQNNSRLFSTLLFERVEGAKLYIEAKENTFASLSLRIKVGRNFLRYYKELNVKDSGVVSFRVPYSCAYNNKIVVTDPFYEISFVEKDTNKRVFGKVSIKEQDVILGNTVAFGSILTFAR